LISSPMQISTRLGVVQAMIISSSTARPLKTALAQNVVEPRRWRNAIDSLLPCID
jgi:hypothetical protein